MNITVQCPSCETSFPVDTDKVPEPGVTARCSVCAGLFPVDKPPAEEVAVGDASVPAAEREASVVEREMSSPEIETPEVGSDLEVEGLEEADRPDRGLEPVPDEEPSPEPDDERGDVEVGWEMEPEPAVEEEESAAAESVATPEPPVTGWEGEPAETVDEPAEPAETADEPEDVVTSTWDMPGVDVGSPEPATPRVEPPEPEPPEPEPLEPEPLEPEPLESPGPGAETLDAEVEEESPGVETSPESDREGVEEEPPAVGVPPGSEVEVVEPELDEAPDPGAGAVPETVSAPSEPPAGFQFGKRDPHEKAQRLARVLVSDMIMYNPERHGRALDGGTLREDFEEEIQKSWDEYVEQVGDELARSTTYFNDALNDILARGKRLFEGPPPH